jgi:hypothetical protein
MMYTGSCNDFKLDCKVKHLHKKGSLKMFTVTLDICARIVPPILYSGFIVRYNNLSVWLFYGRQ